MHFNIHHVLTLVQARLHHCRTLVDCDYNHFEHALRLTAASSVLVVTTWHAVAEETAGRVL